jgi:hypothetical protein
MGSALRSHKKAPIAAIAGGVVGALALLLIFFVGFLVARRGRKQGPVTPASQEYDAGIAKEHKDHTDLFVSKPTSSPRASVSPQVPQDETTQIILEPATVPPIPQNEAAMMAEQLRFLTAKVQQLEQCSEGSSSASVEPVPLRRSLSTMKREQTDVLREHGRELALRIH